MANIFKNVRFRLTLWYTSTLMFILMLYAGAAMFLVFLNLRNNLDHQLERDFEVVEEMFEVGPGDSVHFDSDDPAFINERWIEIRSTNGDLLFNSRPFSGKLLPPQVPGKIHTSTMFFRSKEMNNGLHVRILETKANIGGHEYLLRLVRSSEPLRNELRRFLLLLIIALPVAMIVAGAGGYFLAGKLLAPIGKMTDTARRINTEKLQERLPVINPEDELGRLATTFNNLLDRIQDAFERLRKFTYDAAHELRTPLTSIRSIGEVALQEKENKADYREVLGSILEENSRLTHLVNSLLFLIRADTNTAEIHRVKTRLSDIIVQTVEMIQPLAEEKEQQIHLKDQPEILLNLDPTLFRHALLNLLDNAIKYSPQGSDIDIGMKIRDKKVSILIHDQGKKIPTTYKEKIFERFYRIDESRSKRTDGSGLGLAIARWAITVQGGKLYLDDAGQKGNTFVIELIYT